MLSVRRNYAVSDEVDMTSSGRVFQTARPTSKRPVSDSDVESSAKTTRRLIDGLSATRRGRSDEYRDIVL